MVSMVMAMAWICLAERVSDSVPCPHPDRCRALSAGVSRFVPNMLSKENTFCIICVHGRGRRCTAADISQGKTFYTEHSTPTQTHQPTNPPITVRTIHHSSLFALSETRSGQATGEVFESTINGVDDEWGEWGAYLFVGLCIVFAVAQIYLLNQVSKTPSI